MKTNSQSNPDWSIYNAALAMTGALTIAIIPGIPLYTASAQEAFPDVPADYWAQPFIEDLNQAGILDGYLNNTFQPEQLIDRDEYAAIIRQAFEAEPVRQIASASKFEDVPEGYWASTAIKEAYETGFMNTPTPAAEQFNPQKELTRAEAIAVLARGLDIQQPVGLQQTQGRAQARKSPNRLAFPLASTALMQLFAPVAAIASPAASPAVSQPEPVDLSQYYADADQIPEALQDEIALATQAGLVVNYPDLDRLNPNQPISRGGASALVHQALVYEGALPPLSPESPSADYIVQP
ncbi:S-layer homology domain-containing protein [Romeria aff. gracilis LEGE 07310]|uniref:S-layer homology domain-containing protein n=1 Tax=Vasconcelosia minhoensis LEGE 07310 TaxID=915328 RepID=A0A8J7ALD6_9CYAN|nr:S-layer homology domain-containing protein [Romeria gracilis]MBE9079978.1 S-layer homology domain-containing protein [Romeria aff. gracilis LEGE 07310]